MIVLLVLVAVLAYVVVGEIVTRFITCRYDDALVGCPDLTGGADSLFRGFLVLMWPAWILMALVMGFFWLLGSLWRIGRR